MLSTFLTHACALDVASLTRQSLLLSYGTWCVGVVSCATADELDVKVGGLRLGLLVP